MPSDCATIRRCVGWSAAAHRWVGPPRPDRWGASGTRGRVVGGGAPMVRAASASQMWRFETEWLAQPGNFAVLADLPGQWIDKVHQRRPPKMIVLDMDSSESPTYGAQEGSAY